MSEKNTQYFLAEIDTLIPYVNNARTHDDKQITQLAASIREFGFLNPVIVSEDNTILCGHGRYYAAKKLGLTQIPCIKEEYLTDAQKKAYILADNKLALNAGWDNDLLKIEIEGLQGEDFNISLLGFDESELADLFAEEHETTEDDFDTEKASEFEPFVERGDVWLLGKHRLMCGDSTNADDVAKLMDGNKANAIVTDPPYNVSYKGGNRKDTNREGMTIMNDSFTDSGAFYNFLLDAFKNAYTNLADGGAFYCFHSDAEKVNFYNATISAGFHYSTTCIWVKDVFVLGRADYQMKHEPVIYAFKDTAKHVFYGDRKQTSVWEFKRPKRSSLHPTMKPISLIAYPIEMSSQENGIILDPFGGGGSAIIASEQLNRQCYSMELDPKYASAIVRRYVALKGECDVYVLRNGELLKVADVHKFSEEELAIKESADE